MRRLLAAALVLSACSAPPAPQPPPEAPVFPAPGTAHRDSLRAGPTVVPFEGRAGQAVRVRAVAESGEAPDLCLASAATWERVNAPAAPEAARAGLAGDALLCALPDATGAATVEEVLPQTGQYVLVAEGPATVGAVRLDGLAPTLDLPLLASGAGVRGTLLAPEVSREAYGARGAAGVHLVEMREGERLTVTVRGEGFGPYVEAGAWAARSFIALVGESPEAGSPEASGEAVLRMRAPANGVYAVRVVASRGDGAAYEIRADVAPPEDWALRFPAGGDPAERYALIAAVSDYPGLGADPFQNDLSGPRADAERVRALLVDDLGFAPENVVVLRDAEVTRDALEEGFRRHLGQAGPEGAAFFHYAGHGVQLPEEAVPAGRAEADGLDEALALWGAGREVSFLLDHELGALAESLPAGHVVLALDNCHSGDGTRGAGTVGGAVRRIAYRDIAGRIAAPQALIAASGDASDGDTPGASGADAGARRHVLLSAARAEQPSLELDGLAPDGGRAGAFTTALVRALREAGPEDTFAELIARIRPDVQRQTAALMEAEGFRPQSPQAEGAQATAAVRAALGPREE